jgi:hypothetical protein
MFGFMDSTLVTGEDFLFQVTLTPGKPLPLASSLLFLADLGDFLFHDFMLSPSS